MSDPQGEVDVIVVVEDSYRDELDQLLPELQAAGLRVDRVLREIGMVTGTVAEDREAAVRSVPGIQEVERNREYGIE